jgi:hypothetical protein
MIESETVVADATKVYSRLFDHRAIIGSEIHQFVEEFEVKPSKKRQLGLEKIMQLTSELNDPKLKDTSMLIDAHVPSLVAAVEVATKMTEKIGEKHQMDHFRSKSRDVAKICQEVAWNEFCESLCDVSEMIEAEYEDGRQKIIDFYKDLESQMEIQA